VVLASPTGLAISSHAEQPQSTQRAFEHVFAACERQPACHRAFPNVAQDFYAAYDELNNSPLRVPTTREGTVVFDGHRLVVGIRNRMGRRAEISRLPLLLHELRGGDRLRAARELVGDGSMPLSFLDAAGEIINCNDGESFGPAYRKAVDSANARARAPFRRAADREERECKDWAPGLAAPPIRAALRSDIPTLIVTGYFDDRTPTEHARRIAATLGRAYLAELPDEGHDPPRPGGCHAEIVQRFWDDPTHSPDTSCVARTPSIQFATTWDASDTRR
jgi:pimeloyl-ACP methyl ester carboxylesterase